MRVHVAFTPGEAADAPIAVALDVLRATSTICQAVAGGYDEIVCAGEVGEARALRDDGVGLAGERACVPIPGFDFGNSPREVVDRDSRFTRLVLTTTNGTRLLRIAADRHPIVLVGSLLNLEAVVERVRQSGAEEVAILCAGVEGELALDDAYCAGRIAAALGGTPTDAAVAAVRIAAGFGTPLEALAASESAANLRIAGLDDDIAWCARESVLDVVPRVGETVRIA